MKCMNDKCSNEAISKGTKPAKYCSDRCRMVYKRTNNKRTEQTNTGISALAKGMSQKDMDSRIDVLKPEILDTIDPEKVIVRAMSADDLNWAISRYSQDTWKHSPEFTELMHRLRTKDIETLGAEGYSVPTWKRKEVA